MRLQCSQAAAIASAVASSRIDPKRGLPDAAEFGVEQTR
jgi:hypothetical protein